MCSWPVLRPPRYRRQDKNAEGMWDVPPHFLPHPHLPPPKGEGVLTYPCQRWRRARVGIEGVDTALHFP
jgi:hypothetical protein